MSMIEHVSSALPTEVKAGILATQIFRTESSFAAESRYVSLRVADRIESSAQWLVAPKSAIVAHEYGLSVHELMRCLLSAPLDDALFRKLVVLATEKNLRAFLVEGALRDGLMGFFRSTYIPSVVSISDPEENAGPTQKLLIHTTLSPREANGRLLSFYDLLWDGEWLASLSDVVIDVDYK